MIKHVEVGRKHNRPRAIIIKKLRHSHRFVFVTCPIAGPPATIATANEIGGWLNVGYRHARTIITQNLNFEFDQMYIRAASSHRAVLARRLQQWKWSTPGMAICDQPHCTAIGKSFFQWTPFCCRCCCFLLLENYVIAHWMNMFSQCVQALRLR